MQNPLGFTKLESVATPRGAKQGVVIFSSFNIYMFTHGEKVFLSVYNGWEGSKNQY